MIHKVYLFFIGILIAGCVYLNFIAEYRAKKIHTLETQNKTFSENLRRCKNEMETYIKSNERANETIGEIRTIVKTVKSPCNCYDSAIERDIVSRVRG